MNVREVAEGLTALVREVKFHEASEKYYADDIVSVEAVGGEEGTTHGKAQVLASGEEWSKNHEVHGAEVAGPFLNGDQFALFYKMDLTQKATGTRFSFEEVGVYTVKDGKVVHEAFFYTM